MSIIAVVSGFDHPAAPGRPVPAARRPAPAAHRPAPSVRLTRRGRVVLLGLFVVLAFVLLAVLGGHSAATGEAGEPVPTRTIVVEPGDTLWDIASAVAGPGETREMVHHIQELNALSSVSLSAGQELAVPVG
jgi:LysM repeat protein